MYVTKERFDEEISKRDREISALKSRLTLAEKNVSMTQAAIQAIQAQLAALSTPPTKSIKDSSTEGEKKTQGVEEEAVEVKDTEAAVTKGESSFSVGLEEGEIDEPYIPEYVDTVYTVEEFTADEAQVDEEDEFADEYAFHNDCLLSGVDEVISTNIQDAQAYLKRKLERVRKALERKEREKDVLLKEGPQWDEARSLFKKKELTLAKNEDRIVLDYIRELRSQLPNIHTFYEIFSDQVTNVSVSAQKQGWMMYINFKDSGSKLLSTKSFSKMNIVELYVLDEEGDKGWSKSK